MKNLYKSLALFQQEVPVIHKGTKGYGYSYADLPAIFEVINPLMAKHNLGFTQPIEGGAIRTTIFHTESGEELSTLTDIPENVDLKGMNKFQVLGSAITYIRRYSLSSVLGLITDKDTDAANLQSPAQQQPAQQKQPAAPAKKKKSPEEMHALAINKAIKMLQGSTTEEELKTNWEKVKASVGKEEKVLKAKEEMKTKLTKQAA